MKKLFIISAMLGSVLFINESALAGGYQVKQPVNFNGIEKTLDVSLSGMQNQGLALQK